MNELGKENSGANSPNLRFMGHKGKAKSKSLLSLIKNVALPKTNFSQTLLMVSMNWINLLIESV